MLEIDKPHVTRHAHEPESAATTLTKNQRLGTQHLQEDQTLKFGFPRQGFHQCFVQSTVRYGAII